MTEEITHNDSQPDSIAGTFNLSDEPALNFPAAPELPPFFVPRARLYALKRQLIDDAPEAAYPIILYGPVGSGKTTLVSALAHDADILAAYPDGVLWISLPDKGGIQFAQHLWGKAFGNDLSLIPDTASRIKALRSLLKDKRILLIADNLQSADQALALRVGGPGCSYLFTTDSIDDMASLKMQRFATNRMREEEALELIERWAGILPDIYVPTVKEIVVRLCHLPLALAIIGGQARQGIMWLRLQEVLKEAQGPLVAFDPNDEVNVQKMLEVVINVTLSRFGTPLIRRTSLLSLFAPGYCNTFSVYAAASCWDTTKQDALETLHLLRESALVQQVDAGTFAIHPAIQPHLAALAEPKELAAARDRVIDYFLSILEDTTLESKVIDLQLNQIMEVFFAICRENLPQTPIMADVLSQQLEGRGLWMNYTTVQAALAEHSRLTGAVMQEMACFSDLGYAFTMMNDLNKARLSYERSYRLAQRLAEPYGEANALNNLGALAEREQEFDRAEELYRKSLRIRQELGINEDIAATLNNLAGILYWKKLYDEALSTFERVQDMYNSMNNRAGQAQTWINIGANYEVLGDAYEAQQAYYRSLAIYSNLKDEAGQALALNNLGIIFLHQDEHIRAIDHFRQSLLLKRKINDVPGQAATLNNIAMLYERAGSYQQALNYYQQSHRIMVTLEDPRADVVLNNIESIRQKIGDDADDQT